MAVSEDATVISATEQADVLAQLGGYCIEINFGTPIERMIAVGKYDSKTSKLLKCNFTPTISGKKVYRYKVFQFDEIMWSEEVGPALLEKGYAPATHAHGLAFAAMLPEAQRQFSMLCLGSSAYWRGHRMVLCLYSGCGGRYAHLLHWESPWYTLWSFLGVQEVTTFQ